MMNSKRVFERLVLASALAAAILPAQGFGQALPAASKSKVERKHKAPVSKEILQVKLAKPVEARLKNGLTVLILEDHRFPAVFLRFHIRGAGALLDPEGLSGLADITAQMMREGTETRTARQIAEDLDSLGATLTTSAQFGSRAATITASGLSVNFDNWFGVITDVLLHPTFPAVELDKLKQRTKIQLRQQRSSAAFLANERFSRAVFGRYPAATVAPSPSSVEALTPEALVKWHREHYSPGKTILAVAGDIRAADLISKLTVWFSAWQDKAVNEALPPNPAPVSSRKIYLVDRPNSVQTTVVLGNIAIDRRNQDFIPMVVMNQILGGGPAARLFLNLREEKGYTYGIYSSFAAVGYPGPWRISGNVRTAVTGSALAEIFNEIRRIRQENVGSAELEEIKRSVVAAFALSLEQPMQVLGFAITRKVYDLPDDYWDTYPTRVMAVTAQDIRRVAQKYLNPESAQIIAVGDAYQVKPMLEKYGPVQVFDSDGNSGRPKEK